MFRFVSPLVLIAILACNSPVSAQAAPTATITFSSVTDNFDLADYANTSYQAQITYAPSAGAKVTSVVVYVYENDGKDGMKADAKPLAKSEYTLNTKRAIDQGGGEILGVVVKREDPKSGPEVRVSRKCVVQVVVTDDAGKTETTKPTLPLVAK